MDEVIATYFAAWNEPDARRRRLLLERSVTDDAELVDPTGRCWAIVDPAGRDVIEGIDVVERANDGRLRRIRMFHGPLPAAN